MDTNMDMLFYFLFVDILHWVYLGVNAGFHRGTDIWCLDSLVSVVLVSIMDLLIGSFGFWVSWLLYRHY